MWRAERREGDPKLGRNSIDEDEKASEPCGGLRGEGSTVEAKGGFLGVRREVFNHLGSGVAAKANFKPVRDVTQGTRQQ